MKEVSLVSSLRAKADQCTDPNERIDLLLEIAFLYVQRSQEEQLQAQLDELRALIPPHDELRLAQLKPMEAMLALYRMCPDDALALLRQAVQVFRQKQEHKQLARALSVMALGLWGLGEYGEALQYQLEAVGLFEQVDDKPREMIANYLLGNHYFDLKDYQNARTYYQRALDIAEHIQDNRSYNAIGYARALIGLGDLALVDKAYDKALSYFWQAYSIQLDIDDAPGIARSLHDIARTQTAMGQYAIAEQYFKQSLEMRRPLANRMAYVSTLAELAELYLLQQRLAEAAALLAEAKELAQKLSAKAKLMRAHQLYAQLHKAQGNYLQALEDYEQFLALKEEISGDDASLRIRQLEKRWETDRKEKEAEIHRLRNVELKQAYSEIAQRNRHVTASINYASRIQQAMLPQMADLMPHVHDAFVMWKPRDIVSGDFYWFDTDEQGQLIVVAADCTGHGVPGALMSMIGMKLLEEIVHQHGLSQPAHILAALHHGIVRTLRQKENRTPDGMDAAVCTWNPRTRQLQFAGAKSGLVFALAGSEMEEVKGDRMSIGGTQLNMDRQFAQHLVHVPQGQHLRFYLYTDGFTDQFGGVEVRKFTGRRFRQLLQHLQTLPMAQQAEQLEEALERWREEGHQKQLDDVLVMGVEF